MLRIVIFCLFFGRIEESINCFQDFLTIKLFMQENKTSNLNNILYGDNMNNQDKSLNQRRLYILFWRAKSMRKAWLINLTGFLRLTIFSTSMSLAFLSVWMIMSSTIWVCIRIKERNREKDIFEIWNSRNDIKSHNGVKIIYEELNINVFTRYFFKFRTFMVWMLQKYLVKMQLHK